MTKFDAQILSREEALSKLRALEPELREKGVAALYLFGSTSRDQAAAGSDVDLFADFSPDARIGWGFGDIAEFIEARIGTGVDLACREGLHRLIRAEVEGQAVRVYG